MRATGPKRPTADRMRPSSQARSKAATGPKRPNRRPDAPDSQARSKAATGLKRRKGGASKPVAQARSAAAKGSQDADSPGCQLRPRGDGGHGRVGRRPHEPGRRDPGAARRGLSRRDHRARLQQPARAPGRHHPLRAVHGRAGERGHGRALPALPQRRGLRARRPRRARARDPLDGLLPGQDALPDRHGRARSSSGTAATCRATADELVDAARGRAQDRQRGARQCLRQSPRSPSTPTSSACPSASGSPRPTTPTRSTTSSARCSRARAGRGPPTSSSSTAGAPASRGRPECPRCAVRALCPWPDKTQAGEAGATPR